MKFARIRFSGVLRRLVISGPAHVGLLALLCLTTACGGGAPIVVTVGPPTVTLTQGALQRFMATVTGSTNTAVTWSIKEGAAGGSIDNQGNYTAPQVAGTYHVIATSVADKTQSATATITVPALTVMVSPNPATVFLGAMQAFTAMVTGSANTAVTWAVQEGAAGGSITSAGVYTASLVVGTYHVIATSVADKTQSATATITVPPSTVSLSPMSDTLGPSGLRTFVATVTAGNPAVTWIITEGAAGGTINANGNYIAPTGQGTFHVVATSVADTTKNATATVTVVPSGFLPTGSMSAPRFAHTATLLNTGEALVAGGIVGYFIPNNSYCYVDANNSAELFDPGTGTFTATNPMTTRRYDHTATVLQDGKVLVAGGDGAVPSTAATAEIYNPMTGTFTPTGSMQSGHSGHTATLLPSGKVLIAGGYNYIAELFDLGTGTFSLTGSMLTGRNSHTATLLPNGQVVVTGSSTIVNSRCQIGAIASAELYH